MMSKISQFVSVVVYIHNNTQNLEKFITTVMSKCEMFKQCEIIFVDDYSSDNSIDVIKDYYKKNPVDYIVSIIRLGRYHGLEIAMNAGRDMAVGDFVYEFDDMFVDFDDKVIMDAYDKCIEGNDIVTVSTNVPLKTSSKIYYKVFNNATKLETGIGQESFRLLSRRGINRIIAMGIDIPYRKVIYLNSGLSTANVEYNSTVGRRPPRITEKTERLDLAIDSFIYFTKMIQRVSMVISGIFILFSIITVIYTLISRFMGNHVGMGWASTLIFLAVGFAGLFGLMAFVIRYLSVIVDMIFKHQKYLVADIEKISSK